VLHENHTREGVALERFAARGYWLALPLLVAAQAIVLFTTARQESQTWDEAMHLAAGFAYWERADFTLNPQHPPLHKLLAALPLRFAAVDLPPRGALDEIAYGRTFLFENRTPWRRMLALGRAASMLLALGLTVAAAWWTRRRFGALAALLAATLIASDPNLLAHGRYVTTDLALAFWFFLACALWLDYAESGSRRRLLLAGVCLGGALATKFSAVILLPLLPLLYWTAGPLQSGTRRWLRACAILTATAALVVWTSYLPWRRPPERPRLNHIALSDTPAGRALRWAGRALRIRAHPYWVGLDRVAERNRAGHPSYLLGRVSEHGDWRYFPVAFLVKTPVAVLALLLAALIGVWRTRRNRVQTSLLAAGILFFLFCASSRINLGFRHLLPLLPVLYVWLASVVAALVRSRVAVALLAVALAGHVGEIARIHPYYLAFFNAAAGGAEAGPKYLLDSNIDWGQDLDRLMKFLEASGVRKVYLSYFGSASWAEYPVEILPPPATWETWKTESVRDVVAVSVTPLYGLYTPRAEFQWLRTKPPTHRIGYSIYIWDFRDGR
jgi:hypothetical protein